MPLVISTNHRHPGIVIDGNTGFSPGRHQIAGIMRPFLPGHRGYSEDIINMPGTLTRDKVSSRIIRVSLHAGKIDPYR
jgi:hypothetical protein